MPYLTDDRKKWLDNEKVKLTTAGDLTYCLTVEALYFIDHAGDHTMPENAAIFADRLYIHIDRYMRRQARYEDYAIVLGCLDSTRRELLRRRHETRRSDTVVILAATLLEKFSRSYYTNVVAPYEDEKIEQNGDVYL